MCKKRVKLIKVQWKNKHGSEMNLEVEEDMKARYPHLFLPISNFRMESSLGGGGGL